jgi:hypothetical protein
MKQLPEGMRNIMALGLMCGPANTNCMQQLGEQICSVDENPAACGGELMCDYLCMGQMGTAGTRGRPSLKDIKDFWKGCEKNPDACQAALESGPPAAYSTMKFETFSQTTELQQVEGGEEVEGGDEGGEEMMEPAPWAANCEDKCVPPEGPMNEKAGECMMKCLMGGLCMVHMPSNMPEADAKRAMKGCVGQMMKLPEGMRTIMALGLVCGFGNQQCMEDKVGEVCDATPAPEQCAGEVVCDFVCMVGMD